MAIRPACLWLLGLACLGCQSLVPLEPSAGESAVHLWQKGQEAMRHGRPDQAVNYYQQSLARDPRFLRNHLSLAAAYLERGDEESACAHLARYVGAYPDQLIVRVHLADLQLRLHRLAEARSQFERCVACAQDQAEPLYGPLIHCHARLMQIAEDLEDSYHEHLHRGIGLCILAQQRAQLPDPEDEMSTESLLCKAAGELTLAHLDRPEEARPSWYLHQVWTQLEQRQEALRHLRQAATAAPFSDLTSAEKRNLHLRCECLAMDRLTK